MNLEPSAPVFVHIVLLVLAGACTLAEGGGACEGPMCPEGDGDGDGDETGMDEPGVGEACEEAQHQSSQVCGDGIVGYEEACDDANEVDDDGCSNTCENARGQLLTSFVVAGARAITGVPGPTPGETAIVVGTDPASLVAVDPSGAVLWSTPLGEPGYAVQDIQVTDAGEFVVAGADETTYEDFNLWLARVDAQGQVVSVTPKDTTRGAPHADTLLRADESLVVVGSRPIDDGLYDQSGAFTYDAALEPIWEAKLWDLFILPVEPGELSDGTIVVVDRQAVLIEQAEWRYLGLRLHALDPNGVPLWTRATTCSVDIEAQIPGLAVLSDDTVLVAMNRKGGDELLRYEQDTLISRERWPQEYSVYQEIIADDEGGAWLIGGLFVAYWHPDPARRWVSLLPGLTSKVRDAWVEPGRRLWYTSSTGEVFAVSI